MKIFEHNDHTYSIQNGLLFRKDGNVWAYTVHTSDDALRAKATSNGWKGNIGDNAIEKSSEPFKNK